MKNILLYFSLSFLVASDGYSQGAVQVKDIAPGTTSSFPSLLTPVDNSLFFSVGGDLWISYGLAGNTVLVRPATDPATLVHAPVTSMVASNNTLFFLVNVDADVANLLFDVAQLWKSDGTGAGTTMIKNVTPGGEGNLTDGEQMIAIDGMVYFNGVDSQNGREVWVSDGTAAGTHILKDINPGAVFNTPPEQFMNVAGELYFVAEDGAHGPQIWKSNGTTSGTSLVSLVDSSPSNLTPQGDKLYFALNRSILSGSNSELWMSDGTVAGTEFVVGFFFPATLAELTNLGSVLYFTVETTDGTRLWKTDGTFAGTTLVFGPLNSTVDSPNPTGLTSFSGQLYFAADDGFSGNELWKSAGAPSSTVIVKDINPDGSSSPQYLTVSGDLLFFTGYDSIHGNELWQSDGTSAGTKIVSDINPAISDSNPSNLASVKGTLYFTANDGDTGVELWRSGPPNSSAPDVQLGNVSTRLSVGTGDNVLIGGFIVTGSAPKKVILRAIGPSLPIAGSLADPILELHDSGTTITSNDNWANSPDKQAIIDSGIPPTSSEESAIVRTLEPGAYTAVVRGANGGTGVALVEVYDLDQTVDSKLANISTRGFVQSGDNVMIGGLILLGSAPTQALIRAIGPSLPVYGALADPTLELHDRDGAIVASNDNWKDTQQGAIEATTIPPTDDAESAIVQTLAPGAYTAIVRGKNATTGVALIEAYQLSN